MDKNTGTHVSTPALRPMTEAAFADLLREQHDHIDPTTGATLWSLTPEDLSAFEDLFLAAEFGPELYWAPEVVA